jgi:hypothetical protein
VLRIVFKVLFRLKRKIPKILRCFERSTLWHVRSRLLFVVDVNKTKCYTFPQQLFGYKCECIAVRQASDRQNIMTLTGIGRAEKYYQFYRSSPEGRKNLVACHLSSTKGYFPREQRLESQASPVTFGAQFFFHATPPPPSSSDTEVTSA